jgi:hypothetical protein
VQGCILIQLISFGYASITLPYITPENQSGVLLKQKKKMMIYPLARDQRNLSRIHHPNELECQAGCWLNFLSV